MKRYNFTPISFCSFSFLALFLLLNSGCAAHERLLLIAPGVLPHTTRDMKTAGFWVSRHPGPDKIVLDQDEIVTFNGSQSDFNFSSMINGEELRKTFKESLRGIKKQNLYLEDGQKAHEKFFDAIRKNMNLDAIPEAGKVKFGLIVHYADQRVFPTDKGLNAIAGDIDFDELQNSALDIGTPVSILHESLDGQWFYGESPLTAGWVRKENIAIGNVSAVKYHFFSNNFVIISEPKAEIFLNPDLTDYYDYVLMGVKLPLVKANETMIEILLPIRRDDGSLELREGYLQKQDVHVGYLPYTARNIMNQAFKLLNTPYGWGGMYGEQDCSRFLQEVFSTVGIILPRNSSEQAKVGIRLGDFTGDTTEKEKLNVLGQRAVEGITILPMKGHIMLYLGMVDSRPYAIHATWGYRENVKGADIVRVLNRVVVSDLSLGEGSKKGSLLKRVNAVQFIAK